MSSAIHRVFGVFLAITCAGCSGSSRGEEAHRELAADVAGAEVVFSNRLKREADVDWAAEEVQEEVSRLLRAYAAYANVNHGDSLSGVYLMRRADLLQGRGDAEKAVSQWLDVVEGYPRTGFAPEAMFRIGFVRETALRDTVGALKAYGQLVTSFPESPWSEQAKMASTALTFSEKELLRSLGSGL